MATMAARDRWTLDLTCGHCGNVGAADVSEGDYPFLQDPEFSVEKLHGGFSVQRLGQTALETTFKCDECGSLPA
jgi:hypothetical protein